MEMGDWRGCGLDCSMSFVNHIYWLLVKMIWWSIKLDFISILISQKNRSEKQCSRIINNTDSEGEREFGSQLHHFLAVWPWVSCLMLLSFKVYPFLKVLTKINLFHTFLWNYPVLVNQCQFVSKIFLVRCGLKTRASPFHLSHLLA